MNASPDRGGASREALVRVLAGESRNALARVELAASELARFETAPSIRERIETIRLAVEEMDSLLGKIDLVAEPEAQRSSVCVELQPVLLEVIERIRPSIEARGLVLECSLSAPVLSVPVSRSALESLLLGILRAGLGLGQGPGARISIEVDQRGSFACLRLAAAQGSIPSRSLALRRESRIELEVALAEWGGVFMVVEGDGEGDGASEIGMALPIASVPDQKHA